MGFEPTVAINHTAFRERHLQPLGHLSGSVEYTGEPRADPALPVVPAPATWTEREADQPEDQEDERDPPENVQGEAEAEEQGREQKKGKQDAHGTGYPLSR